MFTTGSKFFYAVATAAFLAAFGLAWTTGGNGLGPLTAGYKGSVGDHLGYTILMFTAVAAFFFGMVSSAFRDADPEAEAEVAGTDAVPAVAPAGVSYWPALAGFSVGLIVLGLVVSNVLFVVGIILLGLVTLEWLVQAWAERATGDPATNRAIRNRLMYPLEVPILSVLALGLVIVSVSRVLLAVSSLGAVAVAAVVAILVLGAGAFVAQRPRVSSNTIALLLFVGAVALLAAGVVAATAGERSFEEHEGEHSVEEPEGGAETTPGADEGGTTGDQEGGLAPLGGGD
ncbi:MAG TPA: hypothetical protein VMW08_18195 [Acidimicrobiales bacterium]|nr:hypothetical protein [Acidimicrobiales bacterium]